MATWPAGYIGHSTKLVQSPVYALFLFKERTMLRGDHTATDTKITNTSTAILDTENGPSDADLTMGNDNGVELMRYVSDAGGFGTFTAARGQYGTTAQAFTDSSAIGVILSVFSTDTITGLTMNYKDGWASFPSGGAISFDRQTGRTTYDDVTIEIQDRDGGVTGLLKDSPLIGVRAVIMAGYPGLDFESWAQVYNGSVARATAQAGTSYHFTLRSAEGKLARKRFKLLDTATIQTAAFSAVATTFTINSSSNFPGDTTDSIASHQTGTTPDTATDLYAGFHLYYSSIPEIVRIDSRSAGASTMTVTRGTMGTTANTSGITTPALFFAVEDNPIDILLGLLLSGSQLHDGTANDGTYKYAWKGVHDGQLADFELGMGLDESEVNIASFEEIRDHWIPSDVHRVIIDGETNMKSFIEDGLLRPMNLNLYTDRAGRLALAIDKPPLGVTDVAITEDDIIGVPNVDFDNSEIINRVDFNYDKQATADTYDSLTIQVDATSQTDYGVEQAIEIKARGVHTDHSGDVLSARYARGKERSFTNPNPQIVFPVLWRNIRVEPGDTVSVTHSGMPDIKAGVVGITNKRMQVVGKRPDWQRGTLELTCIDSAFYKRYGLIHPRAPVPVDYGAATDDTKGRYMYISDRTTEKMEDGTDGYVVA